MPPDFFFRSEEDWPTLPGYLMRRYILFLAILCCVGVDSARGLGDRSHGLKILEGEYDTFIGVRDLADFYDLKIESTRDEYRLVDGSREFVIPEGSRRMTVDGTIVWLHGAMERVRRRIALRETDYRTLLQPMLHSAPFMQHRGARVILLDAGHGGKDSGTTGSSLLEKDIVLDIARDLRAELAQFGFEVQMTREFDRFIPLTRRAAIAKDVGADFMISLHVNSAANKKAHGIETYIMTARGYGSTSTPNDGPPDRQATLYPGHANAGASALLGYALQHQLIASTGAEDRGLRHARFLVLRESTVPTALVEMGFLSNKKEGPRLGTREYQKRLVSGLVRAVRKYADLVEQARKEALSEPAAE